MAVARTVSMRPPRVAKQEVSMVPIAIGAAVAGGLAWFFLRQPSSVSAAPSIPGKTPATVGGTSAGSSPTSTPLTPPPPSGVGASPSGPNGPNPSNALVVRLQTDAQARQIFALQAMAYSFGYTDAVPDGIEGPVTDGIISDLTDGAQRSFGPTTLTTAAEKVVREGQTPRVLPFTLPQYLIDMINSNASAVAPYMPLLQVLPQIPWPSGQVMPYAGYSRVRSNAPYNSVGAQPGYGVVTDPEGTNAGIWQSLYGGGRRSPSGNIAADLNINPVAGQDGSYADGFPRRYGRYTW